MEYAIIFPFIRRVCPFPAKNSLSEAGERLVVSGAVNAVHFLFPHCITLESIAYGWLPSAPNSLALINTLDYVLISTATQTDKHTHTHTHTHKHTYTHKDTNTQTSTRTHTHTHTAYACTSKRSKIN